MFCWLITIFVVVVFGGVAIGIGCVYALLHTSDLALVSVFVLSELNT